jgi:hypothetical protein
LFGVGRLKQLTLCGRERERMGSTWSQTDSRRERERERERESKMGENDDGDGD